MSVSVSKQNKYLNFFNNPPHDYNFTKTKCLNNCNNDKKISDKDLFGFKFPFVICKKCGLVRAANFLDPSSLSDFYKNHYTKIFSDDYLEPKEFFNFQSKYSNSKWDVIKLVKKNFENGEIFMDLGGCVGGVMEKYTKSQKCYLVDYDKKYLDYAESQGLHIIYGDVENVIREKIKPDLILLSHVVEHIVDLKKFLINLKKIMKENSLVYFEFPALDSLKLGRSGDFLNELHIPHIYYFTSYWMKDYLILNGFDPLYVDKYSRIVAKLGKFNQNTSFKNWFYKTRLDIFLGNFWARSKEKSLKRYIINKFNNRFPN